MERGDIDTYVAKFEKAIRNAGYEIDQSLVLDMFAMGLPVQLQDLIFMHDLHDTYEEWKDTAIRCQGQWLHMKSKFNQFKQASCFQPKPQQQQQQSTCRQYRNHTQAMDTSADRGRTRGRLAQAEEVLAQQSCPPNPPFKPREGFLWQRQPLDYREVTCYNCQCKGHISCNCPQPHQV
jgi:hypothetical protein